VLLLSLYERLVDEFQFPTEDKVPKELPKSNEPPKEDGLDAKREFK